MTDHSFLRLTVCGLDELPRHRASGVSHVLSFLDPEAPEPEMLAAYPPHRRAVLRFHDVIERAHSAVAPEEGDIARLLAFAREAWRPSSPAPPAHLLVHCHAGVSRSTAASFLILAEAHPAWSGREILEEVLRLRPQAWPNLLILELGDALLGRGGEILEAAATLYRRALLREPSLAWAMRMGGRGREVRWAGLDTAPAAAKPHSS
jgi:predicted protein tyrosine phosphatase